MGLPLLALVAKPLVGGVSIRAAWSSDGDVAQEGLRPASFFLCGWKNMIDEAKQRILALGYDRKSIHQELYG